MRPSQIRALENLVQQARRAVHKGKIEYDRVLTNEQGDRAVLVSLETLEEVENWAEFESLQDAIETVEEEFGPFEEDIQ